MSRLLALAAVPLVLAACAVDPQVAEERHRKSLEAQRFGAGVSTYSADALAEEIRRNPPANHPNNTGVVPLTR